jgi:hypothetical protein
VPKAVNDKKDGVVVINAQGIIQMTNRVSVCVSQGVSLKQGGSCVWRDHW